MNKPDFAPQWEGLAARIAHIERMLLAGLAVFGTVVGFVIHKETLSSKEFLLFVVLLGFLSFSYLHLMFILSLHGVHLVELERASNGEFHVFRKIFRGLPATFYVGYATCAIMPAGVAVTVAFCYREYAPFPILFYIIPVLGLAGVMTFGVAQMLWRLRKEMAIDAAKEGDVRMSDD